MRLRLAGSTVAFLAGSAVLASAGVPILFPPGQTPQFPMAAGRVRTGQPILVPNRQASSMQQPQESSAVLSSAQNNSGSLPSYNAPPSGNASPTRQMNPRASKEWREEQAKKHFWLFTEKEEERSASETTKAQFGVKEYSYESIEGSGNLDPTFRGLSTFNREPSTTDRNMSRFDSDSEPTPPPVSDRGGAHTSPELSLADMLAPISSAASPSAETAAGMQKLLGKSGTANDSRTGGLDAGLLGGSKESATALGARDVVNRSPDTSWQAMQPLVGDGGRIGRSAPSASPGSLNPGSASPFSSPPANAIAAPGGFNRGSSRVTGFSSLPSPSLTTPREPPSWTARPPEPPRRKF